MLAEGVRMGAYGAMCSPGIPGKGKGDCRLLALGSEIRQLRHSRGLTMEQFAARIGVSSRQMERLFRKHTGLSPNKYYMQLRLAKSRALLLQTDMSVIDVALASGFGSAAHFARCYRSHFGETPRRLRG